MLKSKVGWTITEFVIFCDLAFFVGMHDWCLYVLFVELDSKECSNHTFDINDNSR
jgi:hypothetical protein